MQPYVPNVRFSEIAGVDWMAEMGARRNVRLRAASKSPLSTLFGP